MSVCVLLFFLCFFFGGGGGGGYIEKFKKNLNIEIIKYNYLFCQRCFHRLIWINWCCLWCNSSNYPIFSFLQASRNEMRNECFCGKMSAFKEMAVTSFGRSDVELYWTIYLFIDRELVPKLGDHIVLVLILIKKQSFELSNFAISQKP